MADSELGNDLEMERQKVFFRKIGFISLRRARLPRREDRDRLSGLEARIKEGLGTFKVEPEDFEWISRTANHLSKGSGVFCEKVDEMLAEGYRIRKHGALPSGRMFTLDRILAKSETGGDLTGNDISTLQFLVLEGADHHNRDHERHA